LSKRVKLNIGSINDMGSRFIGAWHRLERGERVRERHLTFPDLSALLNALSPKRLELLRDVHEHPARSVKALAERLGRDYKRVHQDVETLTASGLLNRKDGAVVAPYDAITAELRL
jgi:predicted transcriptional regulator